jgi:protein XRP2
MVDLPGNCLIRCRYHQPEEIRLPDSIHGQPFSIEEVQDCEISLLDYTASLRIVRCEDTTIRCGPTKGICRVERCKGCMLTVACSHLVISECQDMIVFLLTASEPVLDSSTQITFAPYNLAYPFLHSHFSRAELDPTKNLWSRVRTQLEYGGNWSLLPSEQFFLDRKDLQGCPSPEDPVPRPEMYGGIVKGEIVVGSQEKKLKPTENAEEPAILCEQTAPPQSPRAFASSTLLDSVPVPSSTFIFLYDDDQGFYHSYHNLSISDTSALESVLMKLTNEVKPAHVYFNMLKVSAYGLFFSVLLLYLIVVLLADFVSLHLGALVINLLIATLFFVVLLSMLILGC